MSSGGRIGIKQMPNDITSSDTSFRSDLMRALSSFSANNQVPIPPSQELSGNTSMRFIETDWSVSGVQLTPQAPTTSRSEEASIVSLRPVERWKYMFRHRKVDFVFGAVAAAASVAIVLGSIIKISLSLIASPAAAAGGLGATVTGSSSIDIAIVTFIGLVLMWSCYIVSTTKQTKLYKTAEDTQKTLIGALVGFLVGKAR